MLVVGFIGTPLGVKAENLPVTGDNSVGGLTTLPTSTSELLNINSLLQTPVNTIQITLVDSPYLIEQQKAAKDAVEAAKKAQTRSQTVNSGLNYGGDMTIISGYSPLYTNCYSWVKSQRYIPRTRNGNAGSTPVDSKTPAVGAVIVLPGHVGIVQSFTNTTVTVKEANVKKGFLDIRVLPRNAAIGYWL